MTRAIKIGFGSAVGVILGIVTMLVLTSFLFASCTAMIVKHEANAMQNHITNQQPNTFDFDGSYSRAAYCQREACPENE